MMLIPRRLCLSRGVIEKVLRGVILKEYDSSQGEALKIDVTPDQEKKIVMTIYSDEMFEDIKNAALEAKLSIPDFITERIVMKLA